MKHCLNVDWSNWANFFGPPKLVSVTSSNAKTTHRFSDNVIYLTDLRGKHPENKNTYN